MTHSGMLYVLFLWPIVVSDFLPLEIYKNVGPPLSFTVNTHVDNHFNKYIYLFQILYSMKYYIVSIKKINKNLKTLKK